MSLHPLLALATEREVKQSKGFRIVASQLSGDQLEQIYQQEVANAPRRHAADKKYLGVRTGRTPTARQAGRDQRHLAMALLTHARSSGEKLSLPEGGELEPLDALVPLRTAAPDKSLGDADPNKGVADIDLLALLSDDRLAVVYLRYVAPSATRGSTGDTPLRALLTGLAQTAMVDANSAVLREEVFAATGRTTSDEAPALLLAASPRYWELCRKREAQKGAAWIRELERLGREIAEQIGVEVFFLTVESAGDPGWRYEELGPVLDATPRLSEAWETGAGKLKPRPKKRAKKGEEELELVEADPDRPPRPYATTASYQPGDRIEHPKLGSGVVQGSVGRGKIAVLFGEEKKLLVHERPGASA